MRESRSEPSQESDTRTRLLDAATSLFATQGIHGLSMRAVAQQAGARNTAAVHYHFTDREGLLRAVLDRISDAICDDVSEAEVRDLGVVLRPSAGLEAEMARAFLPTLMMERRYPEWGNDGLRVLSRILLGEADTLVRRFEANLMRDAEELLDNLQVFFPDTPRQSIKGSVDLAMISLICGLVAVKTRDVDEHSSVTKPSTQALLDHLVGGLVGSCGPKAGR
ncbi:TetR/AcrR family transcriptional regulator [Roseobacter weihaiensis]|uniref:TetR/AcrR family transcriptional regulator n=1 Tax=Roseobacter weihaiensis TaxID=2763262 RepID=UPI001D0B9089|nr:helix-turn-helix domain-containing protein [Roseobacter sp. H9]